MEETTTPDAKLAPVQPMVRVPDVREAIETYTTAGATEVARFPGPDGTTLVHGIVAFGNSMVHVSPTEMQGMEEMPGYDAEYEAKIRKGPRGVGVLFYVQVNDVQATFQAVEDAGFETLGQPEDQFYGDRTFNAVDPFGYVWSFGQTVKEMTPEEMQQAMREQTA